MRVKEAQILGILALVAAGIILVCIWTGSEEQPAKRADASKQQQKQNAAPEVDSVTDLNEMLRKLDQDASGGQDGAKDSSVSKQAKGSIEMGGGTAQSKSTDSSSDGGDSQKKSQESAKQENDIEKQDNAVSKQIENKEPEDVGLVSEEMASGDSDSVDYVVKKGDTLAEISRKFYKTSSRWRDVLKANKGLISSPTQLRPGMKLTIPSPERVQVSSRGSSNDSVKQLVTKTALSGSKVYKVQKGDTLYSIGKKFYNDASAWRRIEEANSDIIDEEDKITPGMKLILP